MSYSSYVDKINTKNTILKDFNDKTSDIDLETIWKGKASEKQISNLTNVQTELTSQMNQLTNLNDAMTNIDEYDRIEKELQTNRELLNNLNKEDEDYVSKYTEISETIRKLTEKKQELKIKINNTLNSINKSYSNQLTKIEKTELLKTSDLLKNAEEKFSNLNFDMKISVGITAGDVITSKNPGEITLDKQGIYYEKEPTPVLSAQKLHVYHNGQRLYDEACITVKKGETIKLTVNLSDNAGKINQLTRTTADGYRSKTNPKESWTNFFHAHSEPYVNRYDKSTYIERDNYDWVITADKVTNGYVTLSQTSFHSTDRGPEFKSMYTIRIKVVE